MDHSEKLIEAYDKKIGCRRFTNREAFLRYVRRQHGSSKTDAFLDASTSRKEGDLVNIYPLLYQSLAFSIDFLNLGDTLHRNYLRWFLDLEIPPPSKVLDIACGNGYLTCFYAQNFPQSQILGLDVSADAVRCATELATKLRLTNVQFLELDFHEAASDLRDNTYDLITGVTAFNEILEFPNIPRFLPARTLLEAYRQQPDYSSLNTIASLLFPKVGNFISLEKWSDLRGFGWWATSLQNAGLSADFSLSKGVTAKSLTGNSQQVPALFCRFKPDDLNSVKDTIAFWLFAAYNKPFTRFKTFDFQSDLAEAAFLSINPKELKSGMKVEYNEITVRNEIWQSGPFVLLFEFDDMGYRTLEVLPSIFLSDVLKRQTTRIETLTPSPEARIRDYDTPEVDWTVEVKLGPEWLMT